MEVSAGPPVRVVVARALRVVCPACGRGSLFRRFFRRAESCSCCGWRFEREEGFWVGGSEVHMFASYGLSVLFFMPLLILAGGAAWAQVTVLVGHVLFSLALFRYSRSVFVALDYKLDPTPGRGSGDGEDGGRGWRRDPRWPRWPPGGGTRYTRPPERLHRRAPEDTRRASETSSGEREGVGTTPRISRRSG